MYLQSFDNRPCCGFARHNKRLRIEIVDSEEKVNAFLPARWDDGRRFGHARKSKGDSLPGSGEKISNRAIRCRLQQTAAPSG